jgi:hypothetical protein
MSGMYSTLRRGSWTSLDSLNTTMNKKFNETNAKMITKMGEDQSLQRVSNDFMKAVQPHQYTCHST